MSTNAPKATLEHALSSLPEDLRKRLLKSYSDLKARALEAQFDAIGTRAGRFSEVMLRAVQHVLTGSYTPITAQLPNFKVECERLEKLPSSSGAEGLRILVPRALSFLYTLRNKRDFGHAGGEVDANEIDAGVATRVADWCLSEFIRVCHELAIEDAQALCDAIAERQIPYIWNILGRKRVLSTVLTFPEQVLVLLYSELDKGVPTEDLLQWTEHPHSSNFRRDVLARLHSARQIEWDRETEMAVISPLGIKAVETTLFSKLSRHDA